MNSPSAASQRARKPTWITSGLTLLRAAHVFLPQIKTFIIIIIKKKSPTLSYLPGKDAAKGSVSFSVCDVLTCRGFFIRHLNYSSTVGGHLLSDAVVRTPHLPVCWSCQKVTQREWADLWARWSAQRLSEEVGALPPAPFKAGESVGAGLLRGAAAQMPHRPDAPAAQCCRERARPAETGCLVVFFKQKQRKKKSIWKNNLKIQYKE